MALIVIKGSKEWPAVEKIVTEKSKDQCSRCNAKVHFRLKLKRGHGQDRFKITLLNGEGLADDR